MSKKEMVDLLLRWTEHTDNTNATTDALTILNATYLEWISEARVQTDATRVERTTTANTPYFTLPVDFMEMVNLRILERTTPSTNGASYRRMLTELTPHELDSYEVNRDEDTDSTPRYYIMHSTGGTAPGANDTAGVISSSASDSSDVSITGYTADARTALVTETATLNGTTEVTLTNTFTTVVSFTKESDTTGTITLRDSSDAALLTLMPWERTAYRHYIELQPGPDTDEVYNLELLYYRRWPKMVNDSDGPWGIPEEFHFGLVQGAFVSLCLGMDDDRVAAAMQFHDRAKRQFLAKRKTSKRSGGKVVLTVPVTRELHDPAADIP